MHALVASLAAASILVISISSAGAAAPSPGALVLRVGDLPHGFIKTQGRAITNSEMEQQHVLSAAEVRSYGRLLGYGVNFRRSGGTGLLMVQSEVVQFSSAAGAHRYYLRIVHNNEVNARRQPKFQFLRIVKFGNESTSFSYQFGGTNAGVVSGLVSRRGLYLSDTLTFGTGSGYHPELIAALGKVVDGRIRAGK